MRGVAGFLIVLSVSGYDPVKCAILTEGAGEGGGLMGGAEREKLVPITRDRRPPISRLEVVGGKVDAGGDWTEQW